MLMNYGDVSNGHFQSDSVAHISSECGAARCSAVKMF